MVRTAVAVVIVGVLAAAAPALAQNGAPDTENGRYIFNQNADGLLRLDTRTGQLSVCSKRSVGWACQVVPDERTALEAEIARLQSENAALKKELISRGIPLPGGVAGADKPGAKSDELVLKLPSDADLDRAMGFLEKVWRRLIEMVQNLQKDIEKKS
jgi:hypothetical protein